MSLWCSLAGSSCDLSCLVHDGQKKKKNFPLILVDSTQRYYHKFLVLSLVILQTM